MQPFDISILVLAYNSSKYVAECLNSVFLQNFTGSVQLIFLDDNSTDDTETIARSVLEKKIKAHWAVHFETNSVNLGSYLNLKKGLKIAQGKFIAYLEGDDIWVDKNKLTTQYQFLTKNDSYDAFACGCNFIDENGIQLPQLYYKELREKTFHNKDLWGYPPFQTSGVMFRNISQLKLPDSSINTNCNDKILFVLCSISKPIYYNPEKMIAYRYHKGNLTSNYSEYQNTVSRALVTNSFLIKHVGLKFLPSYLNAFVVFLKTYGIKIVQRIRSQQIL